MRSKLATALALMVVIVLTSLSTATAAGMINGKNIKKGSIPLSAISKKAVRSLRGRTGPVGPQGPVGAQGPAGASAIKYWAAIDENGLIVRQTGGISATHVTNVGQTQKTRVTFPADVSACYWVTTNGDAVNPLGGNDVTFPEWVAVGRSTIGPNVLDVAVYNTSGYLVWDTFFIGVVC